MEIKPQPSEQQFGCKMRFSWRLVGDVRPQVSQSPQLTSDTNIWAFCAQTHFCVRPEVRLRGPNSSRKEAINDLIHFDFTEQDQPAEFNTTSRKKALKPRS